MRLKGVVFAFVLAAAFAASAVETVIPDVFRQGEPRDYRILSN